MIKLKILLQSRLFYYILVLVLIIYVLITTKIIKYDTKYKTDISSITGKIKNYNIKDKYITFTIKSDELIKVTFYFNEEYNLDYFLDTILIGSNVTVYGKASKPINNTIPNTFNYKNYLYNNKIYLTFRAKSFVIRESKNVFNIAKFKTQKYFHTFKCYNYLNLFVMGNKDYLEDINYDIYKINGIAHLLAISGMHITLFIIILEKLLMHLNKKKKKVIIISFLLFYVFLTNFSVSILRCVIFYILKEVFNKNNLKINNIYTLLLTAAILVLINPFYVYNISFLYSFVITLGLIISTNKEDNYLNKLIKTSILAFLLSLPITARLNYEINILSIINNIILVPIVSFFLYPVTLLSVILKFLDPVLIYMWNFFEKINEFLKDLAMLINIPKIPFIFILFYYILLALYIKLKKKIYLIYIFCLLSINKIIPKLDKSYNVIYLDVGQGDSSLLISPYKKEIIMIDTGGNYNYNVSNNTILYLKSIGITKINILVLTHGDYDHVGETINIYNKLKINNVIINNNDINNLEEEILLLNINRLYNINTKYFNANNLNNVVNKDENISSLVFLFKIYNYSFLFTGDIPIRETKVILKEEIKTDFLKVSHHGSKYNTDDDIIKKLKPIYAFISSGRGNMYNHPHPDVIEILKHNNVKTFNTQNGSVIIKLYKNSYQIKQVGV